MENNWVVYFHNYIDDEFGAGIVPPQVVYSGVSKAVAKSIARNMNKFAPEFITYWAEPEDGAATYYPF